MGGLRSSNKPARLIPGVEGYVSYVRKTSGKRIRRPWPCSPVVPRVARMRVTHVFRVILELVSTSPRSHDDIMDGAGHPPPGAHRCKWGSSLSVLLGDSLRRLCAGAGDGV